MKYETKDIIIVNFPFSDLSQVKRRPALVLSNLKGNNVILCQIYSKKSKINDYEVFLSKNNIIGNLKLDSYINVDMLFTLNKNQILGKVGIINEKIYAQIKSKINKIFKLKA